MFGMWSGIFPDRGNVVWIYTRPGVIIMFFVKKSADRPVKTARMSYVISAGHSFMCDLFADTAYVITSPFVSGVRTHIGANKVHV